MKGKSIVEVLLVITLKFLIGGWVFEQLVRSGLGAWGLSYFAGLVMILVPVCILWFTRRDWESYGFSLKGWRYSLDVGMTCYLVEMIPWGIGLWLMSRLATNYTEPSGALILGSAYLVASYVLFSTLNKRDQATKAGHSYRPSTSTNLLILGGLLLLPPLVSLYLQKRTLDVTLTVVWQLIFSGFGEEIYYRGYIQSRINQEFGRPYQFLGVQFGPGLIIASLLFGLSHVLNWFQPFASRFEFAWWWGAWTVVAGLYYGLIREKTGSLLAVGLAHGLIDAVGEGFGVLFPGLMKGVE